MNKRDLFRNRYRSRDTLFNRYLGSQSPIAEYMSIGLEYMLPDDNVKKNSTKATSYKYKENNM